MDRGAPRPRGGTRLSELLATSARAYRRRDLIAAYSRRELDRELASGSIVRILPDVYMSADRARAFACRCDAVALWTRDRGMITGAAAAHLHGLTPRPPRRIAVAVPRGTRLRPPLWVAVVRRTVPCAPVRIGGIPTAPLIDAVLESWAELRPDLAASLVIDAVRDGRLDPPLADRRLRDYPRLPRRRELIRLLRELSAGPESYLEHVAMTRVFNTREFSGFDRQVPVSVRGRRHVLDMYHSRARIAVELDGRRHHGADGDRRRDLARDADLASIGITTIRLTFEDVDQRPQWCRDRVRSAVRSRRRRSA